MNEDEITDFLQRDVVTYIQMFEEVALRAHESVKDGILPLEDIEELYDEMVAIAQGIVDLNINPNNAYKFVQEKGLDRIVAPNLKLSHVPLKRQLLVLTRQLFDIAPSTVKHIIPVDVLDSVLQIFDSDDNPSIKAYALDVLSVWLPGNPKMQARVMKLKGLDPFYNQIPKLDFTVIQTLLELFNKILDEHIAARAEENLETITRKDVALYQRIGLLERVSTGRVCDGLMNIFETSLPDPPMTSSGEILPSMFELIIKIEPFCLKVYKRKSKPLKVFNELLQLLNDPKVEKVFAEREGSLMDIRNILEKYVSELKQNATKDEL